MVAVARLGILTEAISDLAVASQKGIFTARDSLENIVPDDFDQHLLFTFMFLMITDLMLFSW